MVGLSIFLGGDGVIRVPVVVRGWEVCFGGRDWVFVGVEGPYSFLYKVGRVLGSLFVAYGPTRLFHWKGFSAIQRWFIWDSGYFVLPWGASTSTDSSLSVVGVSFLYFVPRGPG